MSEAEASPNNTVVRFAFEKSNTFRLVHADGCWGRIDPRGLVRLSFFNECAPLPSQVTQKIGPDGNWMEDSMKLSFSPDANIVREIEVDIVMSLDVARLVFNNLAAFIKVAEEKQVQK